MLHSVDRWLVTDVSGQSIGPIFKGQSVLFLDCLILMDCLVLEYETMGCHETPVTVNMRCVTFQKSEDLIYTATKSWNYVENCRRFCVHLVRFFDHHPTARGCVGSRKIAKADYKIRQACPSVRMEQPGSQWTDFHEVLCLSIFWKSIEKIKVLLKQDKNDEYAPVYMKTKIHFWSYLTHIFLEWEMFQKKVVKKSKHNFIFNNFFPQSCSSWDNVEKFCSSGQSTYDKMAHALCMMDNVCYINTLRICNTCCLSTATMGARKRLNVAL
jgi:hypothetical protein